MKHMNNLALYRKYRPKNFDEISGQSAIVQTLRNQIKYNKIGHAYLFCGLRGSGKTTTARIFAKAINCDNNVNGNPCCNCQYCNYNADVNPDLIEIDAASNNGVENIRQLIDEVNYKPINMKYKVYIIDEVHMLSNSAFNALLKTIEEPPAHSIFILATTELNKVPATIKSRCQIYTFKFIEQQDIVNQLKNILMQENNNNFSDDVLQYIAKKSNGSLRDAVNILDQSMSFNINNTQVTLNDIRKIFGDVDTEVIQYFIDNIKNNNISDNIDMLKKQYYEGRDLQCLLKDLYDFFFNAYQNEFNATNGLIYERYIRVLGASISEMERNNQKKTIAEICLIKMCKPEMEKDYNSIVQRMNNLEHELMSLKHNNINNSQQEVIDENVILYYNSACSNEFIIQEEFNG